MKVVVVGTNQKDRKRVARVIKDKYRGLNEAGCGCPEIGLNMNDWENELLKLAEDNAILLKKLERSTGAWIREREEVEKQIADKKVLLEEKDKQIASLTAELDAWYREQWAFHEDDRDKQIAALTKERNLYKEGLWASDKDCDDSREQIAVLTAENKKLFEEGTSIMHDQGAENILLKEQIAADRRDTAKHKVFWDHAREVDRINFSRFEWQDILDKEVKDATTKR